MKRLSRQKERQQGLKKNMDAAADGLKRLLEKQADGRIKNSKRSYEEIMDFLKTERE